MRLANEIRVAPFRANTLARIANVDNAGAFERRHRSALPIRLRRSLRSVLVFGHFALSYLRDFFSFAILIARTLFMIRRRVALSAALRVVFAISQLYHT